MSSLTRVLQFEEQRTGRMALNGGVARRGNFRGLKIALGIFVPQGLRERRACAVLLCMDDTNATRMESQMFGSEDDGWGGGDGAFVRDACSWSAVSVDFGELMREEQTRLGVG